MSLATTENALFAFEPTKRTVPMTMTRIAASITAYSAISCPSSLDQIFPRTCNIETSTLHYLRGARSRLASGFRTSHHLQWVCSNHHRALGRLHVSFEQRLLQLIVLYHPFCQNR